MAVCVSELFNQTFFDKILMEYYVVACYFEGQFYRRIVYYCVLKRNTYGRVASNFHKK